MKQILLSIFMLTATVSVFSQNKHEQEVENTLKIFNQALLDGDSVKLDRLTDSDLTYGHSLGKIENKKEFIHALASGESDYKSIEVTDQKITVKGKTAVVRHKVVAEITDKGKTAAVKLAILQVWIKEKKHWKLLARQGVRMPS